MRRWTLPILFSCLFLPAAAQSGDPNACDEPGDRPDVIVGDLPEARSYGNVGDVFAYAIGTTSCNVGTCELKWVSGTNEHPVIAQNMYRLKDGRLTQIGQSWLKHGFFALSLSLCDEGCQPTNGTRLGVNCSDPYFAGLNGSQGGLGPRSQVNAATGEFPYPFATIGQTGNAIYKRLQVHRDDLDPALNEGAIYFVEGHYVTRDDAAARNDHNNASWREGLFDGLYHLTLVGTTERESPAIDIWRAYEPDVVQQNVDVIRDGRIIMAGRTELLPGGGRHYEYAIQNLSSDRSVRRFDVPVPAGATVTNIGFHDVDYHSGEIWDSTDWDAYHDAAQGKVVWETATYAEDPLANALRWGTMYNFWFDVDSADAIVGRASIELFKPPTLPSPPGDGTFAYLPTPEPCDFNGVCEAAETCVNCASDCPATQPPCGDGTFDPPERLVPGAVPLDWHPDAQEGESSSRERNRSRVRSRSGSARDPS